MRYVSGVSGRCDIRFAAAPFSAAIQTAGAIFGEYEYDFAGRFKTTVLCRIVGKVLSFIPMPYIEEELEIQCHGENGKYGMLRKLENGKYAVNIHLVDYDEFDQANKIYEKHLPEFCEVIKSTLKKNGEKILSFPYLSEQKDLRFIMWALISRTVWDFEGRINKVIAEKYFSDIIPVNGTR